MKTKITKMMMVFFMAAALLMPLSITAEGNSDLTQDEIETLLHDTVNDKHNRRVQFVDPLNGDAVVFENQQSNSTGWSKTFINLSNMKSYDNATLVGWKNRATGEIITGTLSGNRYTFDTKLSFAAGTECELIVYEAVWDITEVETCDNPLHDQENNKHVISIVFVDTYVNDAQEVLWYQEYGRTTASGESGISVSKNAVQNFTSKEDTHNSGIHYYTFDGWLDPVSGEIISGEWDENEEQFKLDTPITIVGKDQCEEIKIYAQWTQHTAPILRFNYIDLISTGSGSFENTNGRITSYEHTYGTFDTNVPGYTFLGWKGEGDDEIYQIGDTFTVDMSVYEDNTVNVITHYAMWRPDITVNYIDPIANKNPIASGVSRNTEEYAPVLDSVVYPGALTHTGYDFIGWFDEEGNPLTESTLLTAPIITDEKIDPISADYTAYWMPTVTVRFVDPLESANDGLLAEMTLTSATASGMLTLNREDVQSLSRNGYKFLGWVDENGELLKDTTFTRKLITSSEDLEGNEPLVVVYTALWEKLEEPVLSFEVVNTGVKD